MGLLDWLDTWSNSPESDVYSMGPQGGFGEGAYSMGPQGGFPTSGQYSMGPQGGFLTPGQLGASPVGSPGAVEQAAGNSVQNQATSILANIGVAPPGQPLDEQQILNQMGQMGVDTTQAKVQVSAQAIASFAGSDSLSQADLINISVQGNGGLLAQYPVDQSSYGAALQAYDLTGYQFPTAEPASHRALAPGTFSKTGRGPAPGSPEDKVPTQNFVSKNGALYYRNGVLADPNTGHVYYPSDPKVAGSPLWMIQVQKSWGPDRANNWRQQLNKLGYGVKAKGGWNSELLAATKSYYEQKYLNGGIVVKGTKTAGGPTQAPPLDLHQLTGSIQASVQAKYQSMFGQDPTPDELKSWTDFVINAGMSLQKGGPGEQLSPEAALNEAQARAQREISNTPVGRTATRNQQENTTLHDALTSAISATQGLA